MKSLRLRNFRSFRDTGEVPLRPITVLVGENSSGKSSFARFFPLIQQSLARATDGPLLWFGPAVDLGDHATAVRRASPQQPIEVEITLPSDSAAVRGDTRIDLKIGFHEGSSVITEITLNRAGSPVRFQRNPQSRESSLTSASGRVFRLGRLDRPRLKGENLLAPFVPNTTGTTATLWDDEVEPLDNAWREIGKRFAAAITRGGLEDYWILNRSLRVLSIEIQGSSIEQVRESVLSFIRDTETNEIESDETGSKLLNQFSDAELEELVNLIAVRDYWQNIYSSNQWLADYFRMFTYSRPSRVAPERYTRAQNVSVDVVENDGGNLAEFLLSLSPAESSELSAWCDRHLGFGLDAVRDGAHIQVRAVGPSGLAVNVADMGFGVGQVLPVAVQLWAAARDWGPSSRRNVTMMVMEQPELHLHPRMQGKLADILAGAVKTAADQHRSLTLIVETHSEALLNRLGELIEGDGTTGAAPLLRPEDVTVALFEKDTFDGDSTVTLTSFDESGALKKWPLGFFSR